MMRQEYDKYTSEDHEVWSILYEDQMSHLPNKVTDFYIQGAKIVGFKPNRVPNFDRVNEGLKTATGWQVYVVPGLIDNKPFFEHLSRKEFPATTWLRKKSQLKYIEEPDMFHDVFGHVPLLSVPAFTNYLQALSQITLKHIENPSVVEVAARLYWYTVEFGLIRENGSIKIYGAGLVSSPGESRYCVSDQATHVPFNVAEIFKTPYIKDKYQAQYFVINSYEELFRSISEIEMLVENIVSQNQVIAPSYA